MRVRFVDVGVAELCEGRADCFVVELLGLLEDLVEQLRQLVTSLLHAQSHQAERAAIVEDHRENDALRHQRDVHVVALALMEVDRELVLADQLRQAAARGDVAGDERCERGGVDALELACLGAELTVLGDQVDGLRGGVAHEPRRTGEHQMDVANRRNDDLRVLLRIGDDAEVDLLVDDVLVDLVRPRVLDVNVHLRVAAQVFLEVRRQLVDADAVDDGDPQVPADHLAAVL